jgi:hypothetical protein
MNTQKHYISTVTIRNGEYETLTNYCFRSSDIKTAEKEVIEAFDIGGDEWEQQAELYSLNEVTAEEYEVLSRYI